MIRKTERLDKVLAHNGFGSRRDVKKLLRSGSVLVNGETCVNSEVQVDIENDTITAAGKTLAAVGNIYLMMNKPCGVICSTKDDYSRTVIDILPPEYTDSGLFPVGRLDIDTEGLLLLTDDGDFTHRVISPKSGIGKTYFVQLQSPVLSEAVQLFFSGIRLDDDYLCLPAVLELLPEAAGNPAAAESSAEVLLTIKEGKFHQVKRMFKALENEVIYLKRVSIGSLRLDGTLAPGAVRALTEEELRLTES